MRAYFVHEIDEDNGWPVIANNAREAKKLAWHSSETDFWNEWTDIRAKWVKDADVKGLKKGVITDYLDALKRGILGYLEYEDCPNCGAKECMVWYEKGFYCDACEEEHFKKIGGNENEASENS